MFKSHSRELTDTRKNTLVEILRDKGKNLRNIESVNCNISIHSQELNDTRKCTKIENSFSKKV